MNVLEQARQRQQRRRRASLWLIAAMLLTVVLAPLSGYWLADRAVAQTGTEAAEQQETNQRSNFWRAVREGQEGYSAVQGQETNILIQNGGENWRAVRNGPIAVYGGWIMGGMLALIGVFYLLWGPLKLEHGRSGYTIERWGLFDRTLHWFTAISFIILTITGLSLLYGREVLIPYLGKDGFATYAGFAKDLHNYLGPFFAVSLILQLLKWLKHNIPNLTDLVWFLKGGGIIFKNVHPSAGRMNAGEKAWFWILFWAGLALIISGFVLNFPNFGQVRETMQLAHIVHVSGAVILIAVAIGHIYIGTLGSEGTIEGMVTGRVDINWAKQHHDLWYEDLRREGVQPEKSPDVGAERETPSGATPRTT